MNRNNYSEEENDRFDKLYGNGKSGKGGTTPAKAGAGAAVPPPMSLTLNQKVVVLKQMLLGLLKPFEASEEEFQIAQELFVKKFDFDSLLGLGRLGERERERETETETPTINPTSPQTVRKTVVSPQRAARERATMARTRNMSPQPLQPNASLTSASKLSLSISHSSLRTVDFGHPRSHLKDRLVTFLMCPEIVRLVDMTCHYLYFAVVHKFALEHKQLESGGVGVLVDAKRLARSASRKGGIIADVTEGAPRTRGEEEEEENEKEKEIKHLDEATALLGTTKLKELRLVELGAGSMNKLRLNMVKGFSVVKSDALRTMGKTATDLHLPLMILSMRHAVDNLFVRLYKYLSKDVDKFLDEKTSVMFGGELWGGIHEEVSERSEAKRRERASLNEDENTSHY